MSAERLSSRGISALCGLLSIVLVCGCGKSKPWEKVVPVKGAVTHKGKPVKDAELAFFPVVEEGFPESVRPWAKTTENGEFSVSTYNNGDGAPTGRYKVTVTHHEIVISGGSMGSKPNDLPKKYASKDTTDLVIDVTAGETTLSPFELK